MWRFKVAQAHAHAQSTVALPHGAASMMREIRRVIARVDLLSDQMADLETEIRMLLPTLDEAAYLMTMPGVGWTTVAGLIAEVGTIGKYRHGRQLVKLAGLNPSRHESGAMRGRTMLSRRGGRACGRWSIWRRWRRFSIIRDFVRTMTGCVSARRARWRRCRPWWPV